MLDKFIAFVSERMNVSILIAKVFKLIVLFRLLANVSILMAKSDRVMALLNERVSDMNVVILSFNVNINVTARLNVCTPTCVTCAITTLFNVMAFVNNRVNDRILCATFDRLMALLKLLLNEWSACIKLLRFMALVKLRGKISIRIVALLRLMALVMFLI